jgi:hypothetical protein
MFNTLFTLCFWYSLSRRMCEIWSWRTCVYAFGFAFKSGCDTLSLSIFLWCIQLILSVYVSNSSGYLLFLGSNLCSAQEQSQAVSLLSISWPNSPSISFGLLTGGPHLSSLPFWSDLSKTRVWALVSSRACALPTLLGVPGLALAFP